MKNVDRKASPQTQPNNALGANTEGACVIPNGPGAGTSVPAGEKVCFTGSGNSEPTYHVCRDDGSWADTKSPCEHSGSGGEGE